MGIIVILSMSYDMHSKNIDKCGENPQSAHRKTNYHTKCGKKSHKILSVQAIWNIFRGSQNYAITGATPTFSLTHHGSQNITNKMYVVEIWFLHREK